GRPRHARRNVPVGESARGCDRHRDQPRPGDLSPDQSRPRLESDRGWDRASDERRSTRDELRRTGEARSGAGAADLRWRPRGQVDPRLAGARTASHDRNGDQAATLSKNRLIIILAVPSIRRWPTAAMVPPTW